MSKFQKIVVAIIVAAAILFTFKVVDTIMTNAMNQAVDALLQEF